MNIGSAQGLNGDQVYFATQDRNGFMWFVTDAALNRFDGYSFRSYSYKPEDPDAILQGLGFSVTEDRDGRLWMSTQVQGLCSFDPYHEKFAKYSHQPGQDTSLSDFQIEAMALEGDSAIWTAATNNHNHTLDRFDPKTRSFTHFDVSDIFSIDSDRYVTGMVPANSTKGKETQQKLWLVSNPGKSGGSIIISLFDTKTRKITDQYYFPFPGNLAKEAFNVDRIQSATMWFCSNDNGIYGFNTSTRKFITLKPGHTCRSTRGHIHHHLSELIDGYPVMEDLEGNLWTTNDDNEIVYYNSKTNRFYFKPIPLSKVTFLDSRPFIFQDRSEKIWLCTNNGLITVDTKQKQVFTCRHNDDDPRSISNDFVYGIKRVKNGPLFIGSNASLDTFDRKTKSFFRFPLTMNGKEIDNRGVWIIYEDSKDDIWFTGYLKTTCFSRASKNSRQYEFYDDDGPKLTEQCIGFIEDKKGRYWAGQWDNGLYSLDPATGKVRLFPVNDKSNSVSTTHLAVFFEDSKGIIYMNGWAGGFITFNPDNETFKIYHHDPKDPASVSNDNDHNFYEAKNGLIWFGTVGGGINVFNPVTGKFKAFTTRDGLVHNSVSSLIADKKGNFWAGTFGGLSCFSLPDDPFNPTCKIKFRNYDMSDGLPSNQLNWSSAFCDTDGTLYFGTRGQGLFYFHPDSLKANDFIPPVYITEFYLKNKLVNIHDPNSVLKSPIEFTKEIRLNYKQNIISFSFSALNFTHSEKNKYAYMLEGYDKEWIYTDASKRFATYTNLDPKKYIFRVKASNNDGVWNETPTEIKIIITPPFWQTTWFTILVALTVLGIVYAFYRYRIGQILLLQRIRNKIASDLHDDIGSTLNSISVYSEVAKKDPGRKDFALTMIGESSRKIIDSMSDIVWSINPENDSFDKIIFRMRSLTYNLLKAKKIDCTFKADESLAAVKLSMNTRRNFYLIFKEALNNLVKYSRADRASVTLAHENRQVVLIVRDDGIGFDPTAKHNGNGLSNIRRRANEIKAGLNIESSTGLGTTIELNFKV